MKKALLVIDMQNVCVGENHATYFKYKNIKEGYKVIVNENAIGTMFVKAKNKYFRQLKDAGAGFI